FFWGRSEPVSRGSRPSTGRRASPSGRRRREAAGYSLGGVLRGSRCGLRSGPSLGRFRPGGAGVRRSSPRGEVGLFFGLLIMRRAYVGGGPADISPASGCEYPMEYGTATVIRMTAPLSNVAL